MKDARRYSEDELIKGLHSDSSEILYHLYEEYFQSIRQLIVTNSGSLDDAKDVFQETLIILYRKSKDPEFKLTSSLKTYLYSIARYTWLKELEKKGRQTSIEDIFDELLIENETVLNAIEKNERLKLYLKHFDKLSDNCKRILRMFINDVSITEITQILGFKTEQHTKNRRFRCKTTLIKNIQASKEYKELSHGKREDDTGIPRW